MLVSILATRDTAPSGHWWGLSGGRTWGRVDAGVIVTSTNSPKDGRQPNMSAHGIDVPMTASTQNNLGIISQHASIFLAIRQQVAAPVLHLLPR